MAAIHANRAAPSSGTAGTAHRSQGMGMDASGSTAHSSSEVPISIRPTRPSTAVVTQIRARDFSCPVTPCHSAMARST